MTYNVKQTTYKRKELVGVKRFQKMPEKIKLENSIFIYSHKEAMGFGYIYYYYNGNPYNNTTTQLVVI